MTLVALIAVVSGSLALAMTGAWAIQRVTGNSGWIDAVWSLATGAAGVAYALVPTLGYQPTRRAALAAVLIGAWSLRLGVHILERTAASTSEDPRYAQFRKDWGPAYGRNMLFVTLPQAPAAALLALSVLTAARVPAPVIGLRDVLGVAVLIAAILGEGLADAQMKAFKAAPANKGKVCDAGLWGWSRHPNYFFEWAGWLAYPMIAFDPAHPATWLSFTAAAVMFILLTRVSGIPPLEAAQLKSKGEAYRDYQRRVSAFVPLPPKAA